MTWSLDLVKVLCGVPEWNCECNAALKIDVVGTNSMFSKLIDVFGRYGCRFILRGRDLVFGNHFRDNDKERSSFEKD